MRDAILRALYGAKSTLTLVTLEDLLGGRARINVPTVTDGTNWTYRAPKTTDELLKEGDTTQRLAESGSRDRADLARVEVRPLTRRGGESP